MERVPGWTREVEPSVKLRHEPQDFTTVDGHKNVDFFEGIIRAIVVGNKQLTAQYSLQTTLCN